MKTVTILGSTGSVGRQTLDVISHYSDRFRVIGLSAYKNESLLREQIAKFSPSAYWISDECAQTLTDTSDSVRVSNLEDMARIPADITVLAVSGIAGLQSAVEVLRRGGTLAIANKETIVCAGRHLKNLEREYGGKILPLDTEHSAIFSCLRGEDKKQVKKLILTASGGALRDLPIEKLKDVTAEVALRHPVWNMGKKVTIDCATLFNKGLEVIEAMRLFEVDADSVEVVMHRQSIVHSLVEFSDNSLKGLFSAPDMRLAIDTALSNPDHGKSIIAPLNLSKVGELTFSEPDYTRYPCLKLAMDAARAGEGACIALSAADEVLVEEFLKNRIGYDDIADVLSAVSDKFLSVGDVDLEDIYGIDEQARKYTYAMIGAK